MKSSGLSKLLIFVTLSLLLSILNLSSVSTLAEQEKPLQPERHEVKVRLIIVDVIVTKDGQFVTDLTEDDFELYEDGVKRPINSFELISFGEREIAAQKKEIARSSPEPVKKQFVVIFDGLCSFTRNPRQGARKIVDGLVSLAKIGNEVMIVQLSEKRGLEILQPFTTDEQAIRRALVRASGTIWMDRSEDALALLREVGLTDAEIGERGVPYSELV